MRFYIFLNLSICIFIALSNPGFCAQNSDSASFLAPKEFVFLRSIPHAVDGWSEQIDKYRYFNAKELYNIIGENAKDYETQGHKAGIKVTMTNNEGKEINIYFEDFSSTLRAEGMVKVKINSILNPQPFSEIKYISCYYGPIVGGCMAFWSCKQFFRYYIEISAKGYDSLKDALVDTEKFIYSIIAAIGS